MSEKQPKYKWFSAVDPYTNSSNRFVVVVGAALPTALSAGQGTSVAAITVTDGTRVIDSCRTENIGVTGQALLGSPTPTQVSTSGGTITWSGTAMVTLVRRMLVPPGGEVTVGGTTAFFSLVSCACIEDALAIL